MECLFNAEENWLAMEAPNANVTVYSSLTYQTTEATKLINVLNNFVIEIKCAEHIKNISIIT